MDNNTFNFQQNLPNDSIDNNFDTTALQGPVLLTSQLGLVTPTTVAGTLYGVAFALYCLYVHSIAPQLRNKSEKRRAILMLGHSTTVMLCGLCSLVTNGWVTQDAYIKHGDYPGGPYQYISSTCHTQPVITFGIICQMVIDTLTSAIQVWRVWVIFSATRYDKFVTTLPLLCFLTSTALQLRTVILRTVLPVAEAERLDTNTARATNVAIQGATTILCTMLISLFLIYMRWRHRNIIGTASVGYMNIVAMLVESYAMESIWLFIVALYVVFHFPAGAFFGETKTYIEIIAYLLVLYRVVNGKAYKSQRGYGISSLHWNQSRHTTTPFGDTSGTGGGFRHAVISETDILPNSMA